jgi:rod shape-determining protein MreD
VGESSVFKAAVAVALAALLEAVLGPFAEVGWIYPKLVIIAVVFAVPGLQDLQAVLLGFFGGILIDALEGGFFGVGAFGGLITATLALRVGAARLKGAERLALAQVVGISVGIYDLISWLAFNLAGEATPSFGSYAVAGVLPDALLNSLLAYLVGGWLMRRVRKAQGR